MFLRTIGKVVRESIEKVRWLEKVYFTVARESIFLICMFAYYNFALVAFKQSANIFFWSFFLNTVKINNQRYLTNLNLSTC